MDHFRAASLNALTTWALRTTASAILGIVLYIDTQAVAVGQPRLYTWIALGADAVLTEPAVADNAACAAIVRIVQQVCAAAIACTATIVGGAGACVSVECLIIRAGHVPTTIVG